MKFWEFKNKTVKGNKSGELTMYGPIKSSKGWWDDEDSVYPKQFKKDLDNLGDVDEIIVRINSGGGDVFAAATMFTMLKEHPAKITTCNMGIAASAASVMMAAGDKATMTPLGIFMIHDPMSMMFGMYNESELDKMSKVLSTVKETIVEAYMMKTDLPKNKIEKMMKDETWLTAREALNLGFIDEIMFEDMMGEEEDKKNKKKKDDDEDEEDMMDSSIKNKKKKGCKNGIKGDVLIMNSVECDISKFKNFPKELFNTITEYNDSNIVTEQCDNNNSKGDFNNNMKFELFNKYGKEFSNELEIISFIDEITKSNGELSSKLETATKELEVSNTNLAESNKAVVELTTENETLKVEVENSKEAVEIAAEYKEDLINDTLENGVRVYGNDFDIDMFKAVYTNSTIDQLKVFNSKMKDSVGAKFSSVKTSETKDVKNKSVVPSEGDDDYSSYLNTRALAFQDENKVSYKEAVKEVAKLIREGK